MILLAPGMSIAEQAKLNDAEIFAIFDQTNTADIEVGKLGLKKGYSIKVRALAKMVVNDHTAVRKLARDIAKDINLNARLPKNDKSITVHKKTLEKLSRLSGTNFDKAYLHHEIRFHKSAINAINTILLPNVKSERFKTLVSKVMPGFKKHLAETQKVARELGYL